LSIVSNRKTKKRLDMGLLHETLPTAASFNNPHQLIAPALGILTAAATLRKSIVIVHRGEIGIPTRNGQPIEKKGLTEEQQAEMGRFLLAPPGIYPIVPLYEGMEKIGVQHRTDGDEFDIESKEGELQMVRADFIWHVRSDGENPIKARFLVNNEMENKDQDRDRELTKIVVRLCVGALGKALKDTGAGELKMMDGEAVTPFTQAECNDSLLKYGAALDEVILEPITRKDSQVVSDGMYRSRDPMHGAVAAVEAGEGSSGVVVPLRPPSDAA
jgi:hypothetical protein